MRYTEEEIRGILSEILGRAPDEIGREVPLISLGYDSLKFIATVVELEERYHIEILDSDLLLESFADLATICRTLEKYVASEAPRLFKCLIADCDGVLWRGISGEGGADAAYTDAGTEALCAYLHNLRTRGVLLALCSKNERANLDAMWGRLSLAAEDPARIETDVVDKAEAIDRLLAEFGFFADQAIYLDDSEAELAYLADRHPTLTLLHADPTRDLVGELKTLFSTLPAGEAIDRTAQFREQKEREKLHRLTSSPEEYNRLLETRTVCERAGREDAPRLSELSQRANRFNLTGRRYTVEELEEVLDSTAHAVYKLEAADRFGDMGLVAMAVVREGVIEGFFVSCRVFGRDFERELLDELLRGCGEGLAGLYRPTGKNEYCRDFYAACGVRYELLG